MNLKKTNCFVYISLSKHCWVIKLKVFGKRNVKGELKVSKFILLDKSGDPESLKKDFLYL